MRARSFILIMIFSLFATGLYAHNDALPLSLVQKIPLPDVTGRIDHLAVDIQGQRLFVAALGNNTLEVVDLKAGKRIHSIGTYGGDNATGHYSSEQPWEVFPCQARASHVLSRDGLPNDRIGGQPEKRSQIEKARQGDRRDILDEQLGDRRADAE